MRTVVKKEMDIDDFLYQSAMGPITVRDVLYGYGQEIESSGNDFYAHKTGYTRKALTMLLLFLRLSWYRQFRNPSLRVQE